jgi:hypothetical protein
MSDVTCLSSVGIDLDEWSSAVVETRLSADLADDGGATAMSRAPSTQC